MLFYTYKCLKENKHGKQLVLQFKNVGTFLIKCIIFTPSTYRQYSICLSVLSVFWKTTIQTMIYTMCHVIVKDLFVL